MLTGLPPARRCAKASKEKIGKKKEMSGAVGVKKPQEAQKARALWATKAAKDKEGLFLRSGSQRRHCETN